MTILVTILVMKQSIPLNIMNKTLVVVVIVLWLFRAVIMTIITYVNIIKHSHFITGTVWFI